MMTHFQYYALALGTIILLIFVCENSATNDEKILVEIDISLKPELARLNKIPEKRVFPKKLWFFQGGTLYPNKSEMSEETKKRLAKVWPEQDATNDRVLNQLMFVPPNSEKHKTILWYMNGRYTKDPKKSLAAADFSRCPVNTCTMITDPELASQADLVAFLPRHKPPSFSKQPNQIYMIVFLIESPMNKPYITNPGVYNWTSSYKHDSTIPQPYGQWVYYDPKVRQIEQNRNYAQNKTKKVAWLVSDCHTTNGRLEYARELQKYIEVDIYGKCGNMTCGGLHKSDCLKMIGNNYKFYLAFENSNCKEYITEKFFYNALNHDVLPIVMGARREDYEQNAPDNSFIHVEDYRSPKDLADYLHLLDRDDELYNSFFKWKGTGEARIFHFGGIDLWCRTCAMLHDDYAISHPRWVPDLYNTLDPAKDCTTGFWRDIKKST